MTPQQDTEARRLVGVGFSPENAQALADLFTELTGQPIACAPCQFYGLQARLSRLLHNEDLANMSQTDNKFRFKAAYRDTKVAVEGKDGTRLITATNFKDEDAELLRAQDRGHIIEAVPAPKKADEPAESAKKKSEPAK